MSRIEFDGLGTPIPKIGLPPFGGDDDIPPTVLTFTENTNFPVAQYRTLGFTHFEVWCVGAAGGQGGHSAANIPYIGRDTFMRPVPADIWAEHMNLLRGYDANLTPPRNFDTDIYMYQVIIPGNPNYPIGGVPGVDYGWPMTHAQYLEFTNPNHLMQFTVYKPIPLFPDRIGMGGGGGGGGMHTVGGVLADLPDSAAIVVGKVGADAEYGQVHQPGMWTPSFGTSYFVSYPLPNPSYPNPQPGGDGGASSFASTVAQASGGKGGGPGMVWDGAKFVRKGEGGAGGIGGRILAGGGGAGSTVEGVNGADGIWHPETGIGGGGGGGKGGRQTEYIDQDPRFGGPPIAVPHLASAGGQGSYSFGDTSVYGQRQFRQGQPVMSAEYINGVVTFVPHSGTGELILPGGGGGARPLKNLKIGSKAPGYSPNGIVVLRLSRIV